MNQFKNLNLKTNLKMNQKDEEKSYKSRINSKDNNRTIGAIQSKSKKNVLFYKKAFLKNNKSTFIYHKKGKNLSNLTSKSKYNLISGYKKIPKNLYYGTEDTNQSTKGKTVNCSQKKSLNDSTSEKNISPFIMNSNEKNKENKFILNSNKNNDKKPTEIKYELNRKRDHRSLNYVSKIHNITINNDEIKKNIKFDDSLEIKDKRKIMKSKIKKINAFRNFEKHNINISFKTNKNKDSIDLLSQNIFQNIQNSLNKYNNYNNTNTIIINNTIKRNNSNLLRPPKKVQLTSNNNELELNNINNFEIGKNKLVKGKIIKFKYNGAEFFFEPVHNNTGHSFYKKNQNNKSNKELINAANIIKKWWKRIITINKLKEKNEIKNGIKILNKLQIRRNFKYIKYKIFYLNEIIYIQKKLREFFNSKKEKSNFYIKNDIYGCDNSYRKKNDITSSEFNNSIEDNCNNLKNNKIYYKNSKINKSNILLNNSFFVNISNKNLIPSNNNNEIINRIASKNICSYSKKNCKNILEKIIFIQRKIRAFLRNKYYSYIRMIYRNLYLDKINFVDNNMTFKLKEEKDKYFEGMNITSQMFHILSTKKNNKNKNIFNITKNNRINFNGIDTKKQNENKNKNLLIAKTSQILYIPITLKKINQKLKISNNSNMIIAFNGIKNIKEIRREINLSIIKKDEKVNENIIINKPVINNQCFYRKILINEKYLNSCILLQRYFRKRKISDIKKRKINLITKPINEIAFIIKIRKKDSKIKRLYKLNRNNSFKTIQQIQQKEVKNENQKYFNNIEEFFQDKANEKINDTAKYNTINNSHRNNSKERTSNLLNDTDENKPETPIRVMNAKIHKSSIYNLNNITNLKAIKNNNNYIQNNTNKFINIESLPSINSLKTNTENNDLFNLEQNKMTNSNIINKNTTSVSIQTLGSNLSKIKFGNNNLNYMKTNATEGNIYKKSEINYENKNYFYTDNDIVKFSFNDINENLLESSILRENTTNYSKLFKFINEKIIKLFCHKIKNFRYNKYLYAFIQMVIQRTKKYMHLLAFNIIFNRNNKNDFYKTIRKHINIYNKIALDQKIKNKYKNNELILLIKNNIFNNYLNNKFLFLSESQENNFIKNDVFISNDKDLINYFLLYYKYEYKPLDISYSNLIQFRLIKEPLYNMNIFSITKYMDKLYNNIIHENICKICFCKKEESCSINCNCHIKLQNSINLINKIKDRIANYKIINNKDNNSFIEENNKITDRNIRIIIKKVKRTSADKVRNKNDNSEPSSDSKNSISNDIDIFQKMNAGIESIINKVKINKAFKDFNLSKKKQIERTCTEFNGEINQKKLYNDPSDFGCYNVKNHFTTPDKKSSAFFFEKKLFNEK